MITRPSTKEILAESMKELLKDRNIQKITVGDIVANCGLTRTTFYKYFKDKYELMNWIYYNKIQAFLNENPSADSWIELQNVVSGFLYKNRALFKQIISFKGQNSFEDFLYKFGADYCFDLIRAITEKEVSKEDAICISVYISGTVKAYTDWLKNDCDVPPKEFAKILSGCMPHPLNKYFSIE